MKNPAIILLALLTPVLLFVRCQSGVIDGRGERITQEFMLDDFDSFVIGANIDVKLRQGNSQKVFVTASPNVIDVLNTDIENGEWVIDFIESVSHSRTTIEIELPDIRRITIDASGDVTGENYLDLDELEIIIQGSGDVALFGEVDEQFITIDGSGDVENFDLISYETNVTTDGSGDVEVTAEDVLDVLIDGSGDIYFKGRPDIFLTANGSGELIDAN